MLYLWALAGITAAGMLAFLALCKYVVYRPPAIKLVGSHVVITGGSSGIGLAIAQKCLANGAAHVTIVGSTAGKLEHAAAMLRLLAKESVQKVSAIRFDVSNSAFVEELRRHCATHGACDVLVASAGVTLPQKFANIPSVEFERLMRVNYLGAVHSVQGVLPGMQDRKAGRIVLVSSMAGQSGVVGYSAYTPTKFALRGLAEVLSMELCPDNIGVTLVHPPDVDTPMYHEEMKIKPLECKLVSEGAGLFTADRVATDIIRGVKDYTFFVQTGIDGQLLGLLTGGMAPPSSVAGLVVELVTLPLVRFVSLFYVRSFYNICRKVAVGKHQDEQKKSQ
eukprot:TRINITY_DN29410_c0_g1_i1.p1 TRINITY_DN29410_c0_g1~~TRINITY_DN29410_c0_g1_i1.p1  ORF type:complete len:335 (-),score=54.72 TRINITY_DN29410_c0_g1_i1:23-1027(-)